MDSTIIVSLISLVGTLGGSLGGILVSSKLTAYRIEQLEKKVEEQNTEIKSLARRLPVVEEQIKEITNRVDDLEEYHKAI